MQFIAFFIARVAFSSSPKVYVLSEKKKKKNMLRERKIDSTHERVLSRGREKAKRNEGALFRAVAESGGFKIDG